jgi:glucosylceramidase
MTGGVPGKPAKQIDDPAAIARSGLGATNALRNWARTLIDWNVVLDEKGGPNIGPFDLYGTTTINAATKEITRGPNYWAIRHLNQAAARGAVVVKTSGSVQNVAHVAFVNSDGRKCVMLTNTGPESRVSIGQNGRSATITLPGISVTNLTWT